MRATSLLVLAALALSSCGPEPGARVELLDPRAQLLRASVDLRGVHPTETELEAIEADPLLYEGFVDRYLDDPRFAERVRDLFNDRWLTRTGQTYFDVAEAGISPEDEAAVARAIGDEPLRLVSHIVENDLPWSEVVLADYTVADGWLAAMWDIDVPGDGGWEVGRYADGRPAAGVLTMTSVWQRYPSAGGNANRHRANAVSRMLLCDDYLDRPIAFSRNAVDQVSLDPEDAIAARDDCQSCHSTLDPLAAHFFGFFNESETRSGATLYRPENEEDWRDHADAPPAFYGTPTSTLRELATEIATDPRFVDCATETLFEGLTQRTIHDDDWAELQGHRAAFVDSDLRIRALVRSIVLSDEYRAAAAVEPGLADRLVTVKTVSPAQLAGVVEGITGYEWSFGGEPGLSRPGSGLVTLAGGVDGRTVLDPSRDPSVSLALVVERLAQSAAWDVVASDLAPDRQGEPRLLRFVNRDDRPETAREAFEGQIRYLFVAATGQHLAEDSAAPEALIQLWKQAYAVEASPEVAWAAVTSAVLRDPGVVFY